MTVQCPRCRTQYKVPSARINDPRPVFKCTRCSLVFSREAERPTRGSGKGRADDKNLDLPFSTHGEREASRAQPGPSRLAGEDEPTVAQDDDETLVGREDEDEEERAEEGDEDESADEQDDAGDDDEEVEEETEEEDDDEPEPPRRAPGRSARDERSAIRAREAPRHEVVREKEEPAFVASAARERQRERERAPERERQRERPAPPRRGSRHDDPRLGADEDFSDELPELDDDEPRRPILASDDRQRRPPINPRRAVRSAAKAGGRSPLRAVAIGVAAIAAIYLGLAVALDRRPAEALETLSQVPILGRLLGGDHLLVWRLQLAQVEGGLDQIKGGRPAYVVTGRAINTTSEDLRIIEIEGRLLANGVEQRRQTVYAANQQRKTVHDLSPSEVEMLLRLEPNRRFVIRPGESASFLLVFPDPPPGTTEVTCRVVNARTA